MKHYIRSYWTKYKQLYKKGLKGIAAFLAIRSHCFLCIGYYSESWNGRYLQRGYGATDYDAWFCNCGKFICNTVGTLSFTDLVWKDPDGREIAHRSRW